MEPYKKKIILIEDDYAMGDLLQTLLQIEGYQTCLLKIDQDANRLVEAVCQEEPELILMDVHLRQTSGLELIGLFKKEPCLDSTHYILSSGINYQAESVKAGADAFILKPYMPDELVEQIKSILGDTNG